MWDPQNPTYSHYDAILWLAKYSQVYDQDEDDLDRCSPMREQMTWHEYEVIDLKEDSDIPTMQQTIDVQYKCSDLQFLTHLFTNIISEWVDFLPEEIDDQMFT